MINSFINCFVKFSRNNIFIYFFYRTAAKAYYGIVNCYLANGNILKAESIVDYLDDYEDSYVKLDNDNKTSYKKLSKDLINNFKNLK